LPWRHHFVVVVAAGVLGVDVMSVLVEPEAPIEVPLPVEPAVPVEPMLEPAAAVSVLEVAGVVGIVEAVSVDEAGAGTLEVVEDVVDVSVTLPSCRKQPWTGSGRPSGPGQRSGQRFSLA
jgi:hypothetical protein